MKRSSGTDIAHTAVCFLSSHGKTDLPALVGAVRSEGRKGKPAAEPLRRSRHDSAVLLPLPLIARFTDILRANSPRRPAKDGAATLRFFAHHARLLYHISPSIAIVFSHFSPYFCVIYNLFTFKNPSGWNIGMTRLPKGNSRLHLFSARFSATPCSLQKDPGVSSPLGKAHRQGEQKTLFFIII